MEIGKIVIGCVLSAVLAVPALVLAAGGSQMGTSQMGGESKGKPSMERTTNRTQMRTTISAVQEKLNAAGYNVGKADGIWGPRSATALKKYQQEKGLQVTGRLDEDTAKALGLEEGEFARFEEAIQQRSRTHMEQKQQIKQPSGESGGM